MSRSGYTEDDDFNTLGLWRNAVERSLNGKRGQAFLRELLASLDAMPQPRLAAHSFQEGGEVCALGSVGVNRGTDMTKFGDRYGEVDRDKVSEAFGISPAMAAEIMFVNDDDFAWNDETPERRFKRVRQWVVKQIKVSP